MKNFRSKKQVKKVVVNLLKIVALGCLFAFFGLSEISQLYGTAPYNRGAFVRLICGIDKYNVSGVCTAVGNGYYAPNATNSRTACTNSTGGAQSVYTSEGGGTNNCSWGCNTDYYLSGTCIAVGNGYYSPYAATTRTACSNSKPTYSYYSGPGGGANNCPNACNSGYYPEGTCNCWNNLAPAWRNRCL